ncbi:GIY-YIG nuclease family protein [Pseudorhodobacter sp. W20_MBD10_FR17]|uniref:GIY-YIG nuclease family protein n=1 Tax=Pseudorhodobacter sp. W20_MBD10_FR17 TaxID=3240266 RepID=UPI003F96F857
MGKGRSVKLFLAEGSATGILTAEIINWTGHALAAPRTRLEAALKREELKRTGIYILYSDSFGADLPSVYVGEGDDFSVRLRIHSRDNEKDYWDRFIAVTSKDMNLTKAHVKYLEGRLISLLTDAKKCELQNKTEPTFDKLPEADISDMETFLEELQLVLPVIGVDFFRKPQIRPQPNFPPEEPQTKFYLRNSAKGIIATAVEADGEFVILAGATGSLNVAPSFNDRNRNQRDQALESGRAVKLDDKTFRLQQDIGFTSPSAAAVFLFGTSRNGRTDWLVDGQSITYGQWSDAKVQAAE